MSVIIDNGSYSIRAGFLNDQNPRHAVLSSQERKNLTRYPIQNGLIFDWDLMEKIWHQIFYDQLKINPQETQITMTCNLFSSKCQNEKLTQIMFETYDIPELTLQFSSVASLISTGRMSGLVIDSGYEETFFVPVYEGYRIQNDIEHLNIGGKHSSEHLLNLITQKYQDFRNKSFNQLSTINNIKENFCHTSMLQTNINKLNYELPDGSFIELTNELKEVPEILFKPELIQETKSGIQNQYAILIQKIDLEQRECFLKNTILAGGNSRFNGLFQRLLQEIKTLLLSMYENKLNLNHADYFSSWQGCSIAKKTQIYQTITQEEYNEYGPQIVLRKFF